MQHRQQTMENFMREVHALSDCRRHLLCDLHGERSMREALAAWCSIIVVVWVARRTLSACMEIYVCLNSACGEILRESFQGCSSFWKTSGNLPACDAVCAK